MNNDEILPRMIKMENISSYKKKKITKIPWSVLDLEMVPMVHMVDSRHNEFYSVFVRK